MPEPLVLCENLVKIYKVADLEVVALQGLDLDVLPGEMMAMVGASGSGKTTLLNILGGLDIPSAGACRVAGHNLTRMGERERVTYRQEVIGHVWQQSGRNLLPELTAAANIELPQMLAGIGGERRKRRARELLELIGLGKMSDKRPDHLSGGEQQRVAIAVALANDPALLLADELTGELDSETASEICALLRTLNRELGQTVLVVTHDVGVAATMDRTIAIRDGRTSTETIRRAEPLTASVTDANGYALRGSAVIGLSTETHHESLLIDRVGRLQLPKEAIEVIAFNGRAQAIITSDHVELWPLAVDASLVLPSAAPAEDPTSSVPDTRTGNEER